MPWRMRYYQPAVLAMFYSQSEKYWIQTDEFEGTVRIRDDYLKSQGSTRDKTYLNAAMAHSPCLQARNPKATLRVYSFLVPRLNRDSQFISESTDCFLPPRRYPVSPA